MLAREMNGYEYTGIRAIILLRFESQDSYRSPHRCLQDLNEGCRAIYEIVACIHGSCLSVGVLAGTSKGFNSPEPE